MWKIEKTKKGGAGQAGAIKRKRAFLGIQKKFSDFAKKVKKGVSFPQV